MRMRAWARVVAAGFVLVLGWLVWSQVQKNWAALSGFHVRVSWARLGAAFALGTGAFVLEARAWQRAINASIGRKEMGLVDSFAMVNASGLLKYLPGRVWSYGAQVMWLARRGISGTTVVYVNVVCILCSILVSTLFGSAYLVFYFVPPAVGWPLFGLLLLAHAFALVFGPRVIPLVLGPIRRITGRDLVVAPVATALMAELGGLYVVVWAFMGAAGYYSGGGAGLPVAMGDVVAITASMSVSWVVGYLSAVTPGGMGVREGLMYLMLSKVGNAQVALLLPVVSRLLYIAVEVFLGALGAIIGLRRGLFQSRMESTGELPG